MGKHDVLLNSRYLSIFAVLFLLLGTTRLLGQRTDVVILKNGDKITGEIKKLDRGILEFKTDSMDTLNIEWEVIDFIQSKNLFDVESISGLHYIGPIQKAEKNGQMIVATEQMDFTLSLKNIVRIYALEETFWRRFKGFVDAGFGYQKADQFAEFTLGGEISIRSQKWSNRIQADLYLRHAKEGKDIARNTAMYRLERIFPNRWAGTLLGSLEQNDELNLDFRALIGLAVGRYLVQNNHMLLTVTGGLTAGREKLISDDKFTTSLEALIATSFEAFRFQTPRLDFTARLIVYPSLNDFGRIRFNFDTRLRYEILRDFYIGLKLFDHFDGDFRKEGIKSNDFGINATISYSFK
jgi:hypothetical protein